MSKAQIHSGIAGPAAVRVAGVICARARVYRSAGAVDGLARERVSAVRNTLEDAEKATGGARRQALTALAAQLDSEAAGSHDPAKMRLLAGVLKELSNA